MRFTRLHEVQLTQESIDLVLSEPENLYQNVMTILRYGHEEVGGDVREPVFIRVPFVALEEE